MTKPPPAPGPRALHLLKQRPRRDETLAFEIAPSNPRKEIVIGDDADEDTQRMPVPDEFKPKRRTLPLLPERMQFAIEAVHALTPNEMLVDIDEPIDCAYVILEGRARVFPVDLSAEDVIATSEALYEFGPGEMINAELFTEAGAKGLESAVRVCAKTKLVLVALTPEDLVDPAIAWDARIERIRFVTHVLASSAIHRVAERERHRREEETHFSALDQEIEKREELGRKFLALRQRNEQLNAVNRRLNDVNRHITNGAVEEAVKRELQRRKDEIRRLKQEGRDRAQSIAGLEAEIEILASRNASLNERMIEQGVEITGLRKKSDELEKTSISQMKYVQHVTEEVLELERLRDLLGLETNDPKRLIKEIEQMFLKLYELKSPRLQRLGVLGLGELSQLGVTEDELPSLTDQEIDEGLSELPRNGTDPTKNSPNGE